MYYTTHGDTVVYRSNRPDRAASRSDPRLRAPERESRRLERPADALLERLERLEARVAELEAELRAARRHAGRGKPGQEAQAGGEVRVSVHAEGGTHATVGPVRIVHD